MTRPWRSLLIMLLATGSADIAAALLRDPTQPPSLLGKGTNAPVDAFRPQHLMIVSGERFLVWQGRRYRTGERFPGGKIERITESEVWLRGSDGLRKLPLFPSTEKHLSGANGTASTINPSRPGQTAGKKEPIK